MDDLKTTAPTPFLQRPSEIKYWLHFENNVYVTFLIKSE